MTKQGLWAATTTRCMQFRDFVVDSARNTSFWREPLDPPKYIRAESPRAVSTGTLSFSWWNKYIEWTFGGTMHPRKIDRLSAGRDHGMIYSECVIRAFKTKSLFLLRYFCSRCSSFRFQSDPVKNVVVKWRTSSAVLDSLRYPVGIWTAQKPYGNYNVIKGTPISSFRHLPILDSFVLLCRSWVRLVLCLWKLFATTSKYVVLLTLISRVCDSLDYYEKSELSLE